MKPQFESSFRDGADTIPAGEATFEGRRWYRCTRSLDIHASTRRDPGEDAMRKVHVVALVMVGLQATAATSVAQVPSDTGIQIRILSGRPDLVSGGDALVEVAATPSPALRVTVNDRDVTAAFRERRPGTSHGLVEGLVEGRNVLRAMVGSATSQIELINHPIAGPIVSGPHIAPFVCMTQESGLGEPQDDNCSAPTRVEYFYRPRGLASDFRPLPDPSRVPGDVAEATTRHGRRVPYIVRVESGTINRSIYRIAVLDDPRRQQATGAWTPGEGWNGRLVMMFGPGCNTFYTQGRNTPQAVLNDLFLSRGFASMTSTLNVLGLQCNDALSGETFMMLKEHFIERYGIPAWTVGTGGSGGAIQQFLIAQNFPGLLDGLMPTRSFPDLISMWSAVGDCRLLNVYFDAHKNDWTDEARQAVEGWSAGTCRAIDGQVDTFVATKGCNIGQDLTYDPLKNPRGARCTVWDTNVNTYGRDASTGGARRTYDNVGIQYGLHALNRGGISKRQFLDLNANIGGFDRDGNTSAARTAGDLEAIRMAYAAGRINTGGGSLGSIPIISFRAYLDDAADIHDRVRDMVIRLRLERANGRSDNYVSWLSAPGPLLAVQEELALDTMGKWLDAVAADTSGDSLIRKVVRAKPARAVDACWDRDATRIDEPFTFDEPSSRCNKVFPVHSNVRMVAGEPRTVDVLKCQLKPLSRRDYAVTFSDDEWQRLRQVFPDGVCDYGKPGMNARTVAGTYQRLPLSSTVGSR